MDHFERHQRERTPNKPNTCGNGDHAHSTAAHRHRKHRARLAAFALLDGLACGPKGRSRRCVSETRNHHTEDGAMTIKKPITDAKPTIIVANDPDDRKGRLKTIGGSESDHWNNLLVNQVVNGLWLKNSDAEMRERQMSATAAALLGIGPKDELGGMVAAQLIAAHNAAMECYRRAMIGEQSFEGRRENLAHANKLSRTYAALLEALNRHRGKGQQKVTVEHVHFHAGGQAVVGVVGASSGQGPGGGDCSKPEEQPHAKQLAHALEPALPSPDAGRHAMPIARDDERALPDARRRVARCAEGQ
jgi:hypothetical protein